MAFNAAWRDYEQINDLYFLELRFSKNRVKINEKAFQRARITNFRIIAIQNFSNF